MYLRPSIYTASKLWHAPKWRELRERGVNVQASWIDFPERPATDDERLRLWVFCAREAAAADFMIFYAEPGEVHKGALVEAGGALSCGKVVIQVGTCGSLTAGDGSDVAFTRHPNWRVAASIDDALRMAGNGA